MTPADIQRLKDILPTTLGSEEIRETYAREILQRSIFSARMASAPYLSKLQDVLEGISSGQISQGAARGELIPILERMGHSMQDGGGVSNPIAITRLNLIIDTNRQMAASVAKLAAETPATVAEWPAWRLTRMEGRSSPREDWPARWRQAGESVGWEGALRMSGSYPDWDFVALKSSPIWQALGDGAGGFRDTLGNPYPPFAFNSGLDWEDVDADECAQLGLDADGAQAIDAPSLTPGEQEIADAIKRLGGNVAQIAEGIV